MLFYEPLFLFVFWPTVYLLYLALERGYPNLTAYIVDAVNNQLQADGSPFRHQPVQAAPAREKRGRKKNGGAR